VQLQPRQNEEPEISLTSLIDVVFLLLLFFMVSTTFEHQATLKVNLPEASSEPAQESRVDRLELIIDSQGQMFLNDRQLVNSEANTLRAALVETAGEDREQPLILRADSQTPHHFVVTAMDVIGQLGFSHLSIATQQMSDTSE
jgi:biopolymer transport protein ExbD